MKLHRVIPVLLNDGDGLYKTKKFAQPNYIGDPLNTIRIFNAKGVDELLLIDIGRSRDKLGPNFRLVERCVAECFAPLTYGGGIRSLDDAKTLFRTGIEKILIQTLHLERPQEVSAISNRFGASSVSVSLDVKCDHLGQYRIFNSARRVFVDGDLRSYVESIEKSGAGEIVLTAVDMEGAMQGMDLKLIDSVTRWTSLPVVAHGGAGSVRDFSLAIKSGASAVAAGSLFVYYTLRKGVLINYIHSETLGDDLIAISGDE
jgi:cyclase